MPLLKNQTFVCLDCETTGLDPKESKVIEFAAVKFNAHEILDSIEFLINPKCPIPKESQEIHNITQEMVDSQPVFSNFYSQIMDFVGQNIIVGHAIQFDLQIIAEEAKKIGKGCDLPSRPFIDTLRLARLYGECPVNSLEKLRQHFNIPAEGAHRAMSDVIVNIEVFKYLTRSYTTVEKLLERLRKPIQLRIMPLGKHKGRKFTDIPTEYLLWLSKKDFDLDLTYSIRSEIKKRKTRKNFQQAVNPFQSIQFDE